MAAALAQHQTITNFGTTAAGAFSPATTANRLLTCVVQDQQAADITGITDSANNAWVKAASLEVTSQKHIEIWYATNAASCTTVTINVGATSANLNASIQEWSGTSGWSLRDAATVNVASGTAPAGSVTTVAGDIVLSGLAYLEAASGTRQDTLSSGTLLDALARGTTAFSSAYKITTLTSDGCTWTMSPATSSVLAIASFGPASVANVAPTAVIDAAKTASPWTTVTHSGSGSTDSDGTIASYAWTQTAGPTVTLAGANTASVSYTAPPTRAGTTISLQLIVTDNSGALSPAVTVSDTIYPTNEWAVVGGVEIPLRVMGVGTS